jgi:hypothetical protein
MPKSPVALYFANLNVNFSLPVCGLCMPPMTLYEKYFEKYAQAIYTYVTIRELNLFWGLDQLIWNMQIFY